MNLIILFILGILQLLFGNELSYLPLVFVKALPYVFYILECVLSVLSLKGSVSQLLDPVRTQVEVEKSQL